MAKTKTIISMRRDWGIVKTFQTETMPRHSYQIRTRKLFLLVTEIETDTEKFRNIRLTILGRMGWNALQSVDIRSSTTITEFKQKLKTRLFGLSYPDILLIAFSTFDNRLFLQTALFILCTMPLRSLSSFTTHTKFDSLYLHLHERTDF